MIVVILIGLPGSGKTTLRKMFLPEYSCICVDEIRLNNFNTQFDPAVEPLVWDEAYSQMQQYLENKQDFVLDCANISRARRYLPIALAQNHGAKIRAIHVDVPIERCKQQNAKRKFIVPEEVIDRMAESFEAPAFDEGFDQICVISPAPGSMECEESESVPVPVEQEPIPVEQELIPVPVEQEQEPIPTEQEPVPLPVEPVHPVFPEHPGKGKGKGLDKK